MNIYLNVPAEVVSGSYEVVEYRYTLGFMISLGRGGGESKKKSATLPDKGNQRSKSY